MSEEIWLKEAAEFMASYMYAVVHHKRKSGINCTLQ